MEISYKRARGLAAIGYNLTKVVNGGEFSDEIFIQVAGALIAAIWEGSEMPEECREPLSEVFGIMAEYVTERSLQVEGPMC